MPPKVKYYATAALMGIGWFLVLLIPPATRGWLLMVLAPYHLAFLVIASVMVALLFRRSISTADTILKHLVCGCVIPYVGCVFYVTIFNLFMLQGVIRGAPVIRWDQFVAYYVLGLFVAFKAYFVVLPFGILSQYIMHKVAGLPPAIQESASV